MKTLPAGLQDFLDAGATTMCYCWRVTRNDEEVQGFTEHDRDLTFLGTTFEAASGFTATQMEQSLGLSVDNLDVDGALSSDTLNEDDLAAGLYDNAKVELFWVNFEDLTKYVLVSEGTLGEVQRMETAFKAELRSKADKMGQRTGRTYQRYCDADLGDSRCTVDIEDSDFKGSGTVVALVDTRAFTVSGITGYDTDWFTLGKVTFTSGANDGLTYEVRAHDKYGSTVTLETWFRASYPVAPGDTFEVRAGCKKDSETCKAKFNNIVNFQGFPFIPGNDIISSYPVQGGAGQTGGSIFTDDAS